MKIGLIPAGAGNMKARTSPPRVCRAHPRGCGEHARAFHESRLVRGSSPRVRGTSGYTLFGHLRVGLIPAGAGNIIVGACCFATLRAHPRGCGEHCQRVAVAKEGPGSSPRVRGTSHSALAELNSDGLIPAGAGNIQRP